MTTHVIRTEYPHIMTAGIGRAEWMPEPWRVVTSSIYGELGVKHDCTEIPF